VILKNWTKGGVDPTPARALEGLDQQVVAGHLPAGTWLEPYSLRWQQQKIMDSRLTEVAARAG
jgi:hypothetical protein